MICIYASSANYIINRYCIHYHISLKRDTEQKLWTVQAAIVRALRANRGLIYVWVFVHPSCDMTLDCGLRRAIQQTGWILSTNDVYYSYLGDTVANYDTFFIGIHKGSTAFQYPFRVVFPPITKPKPLASFIYALFNRREYAVSVYSHHEDFSSYGCFDSYPVTTATTTRPYWEKYIYNIHHSGKNIGIFAGAGVYDISGLCPPFCASNSNMFAFTFGVYYEADGVTLVRPIPTYEIACCFRLDSDLTYEISHPEKFCLLDCGIPSRTSAVLLNTILKQLDKIRNENFDIFNPSRYSAPAAIAQVPDFTNGAVGSRIPDNKV